ncbi:MAG TPA: hypothetical protein VH951_09805 [Dehalococcoidia bacterium]
MVGLYDLPGLPVLHLAINAPWVPRPAESHDTFGSGFLLVGAIMTAEKLSGSVWHRNLLRTMIFPAILVILGWGMLIVVFVETQARIAHVSMGLPMIAGGWAEARYRLGQTRRAYTDMLIVPSLVLAAVDTGFFHLSGNSSEGVLLAHVSLVFSALLLAFFRAFEGQDVRSLNRSLIICGLVLLLSLQLYADGYFQT